MIQENKKICKRCGAEMGIGTPHSEEIKFQYECWCGNVETEKYSAEEIKQLATDFDINYSVIDAEERLALSPMKQKDLFRDYLHQIEAGNITTKPPRPWSSEWKPKD